MKLFSRKIGSGHPFIIIHGLYGSSDNWWTIAKEFSQYFEVHTIDQRNHGQSPWDSELNYRELSSDLIEYMDDNGIEKAILLGHSMGGKTAMFATVNHIQRVSRLIVADISPLSYKNNPELLPQLDMHQAIIKAMTSMDFTKVNGIATADSQLETTLKSQAIRQLLLKNLKHQNGQYQWRLNIESIAKNISEIIDGFTETDLKNGLKIQSIPVLFLKGQKSDYIKENDKKFILKMFPNASLRTIPDAGHWLHAEQPEIFCREIRNFVFK